MQYPLLGYPSHQEGSDLADGLIQYLKEKEPGDSPGYHSTSHPNERAWRLFFFSLRSEYLCSNTEEWIPLLVWAGNNVFEKYSVFKINTVAYMDLKIVILFLPHL